MGHFVPQTAGVRADLVGQHDLAVRGLAELQLEIHQVDAHALQEALEQGVDAEGVVLDEVDLLPGSHLQGHSMVSVHQRVAQVVVLVGELDGGIIKDDALFHAKTLGEGTGGDVADDDFQGHDGDLLHGGLPFRQLFDEMGGDALGLQLAHHVVAHAVVDDALAGDAALLDAVECGGVVLVVHDDHIGIVGCEYLLGLAFIDLFQFFHLQYSSLSVSSNCRWYPMGEGVIPPAPAGA